MPKKGTPEYEIWRKKFFEKKASASEPDFLSEPTVVSLKKKLSSHLLEEHDLILFIALTHIEVQTLSVVSLDPIKTKFVLSDSEFDFLVSVFRTYSKDILKLRVIGVLNFMNVLSAGETYPEALKEKYTREAFKKKYGHNFDLVYKAFKHEDSDSSSKSN